MKFNRRTFIKYASAGLLNGVWLNSGFAENQLKIPDLAFVQLTDTHISSSSGSMSTNIIVNMINKLRLPYDLVIHTGDIIHSRASEEEMKQASDFFKFRKKAYFVPGNHDITFDRSEKYVKQFETHFNPVNYTIHPQPGIRFAFFNSQAISDRAFKITRKLAFEALRQMLDKKEPTLLFCHAPGLPDFYNNKIHIGWKDETMQKWTDIMKAGGVKAVLAGHFHRDEYHIVNDIPFYICAPVAGFWGRQGSFRHWTMVDGQFTYRTIYI